MHDALRPWTPGRDGWDLDAAAHLWRRAGFGAPPAEVRRTLDRPPAEAVAALVRGPAEDPATDALESIYGRVLGADDADAARAWLLTRMVRGGHPLREKLALFWHGHFATSIRKVERADWMLRQYRLFLDLGLGRFGALLGAVTRDPAMIRWLDNDTNRKGHANENYARELFELFTLGEGHYTERDVQEAARAFTGWHVLNHRFHFSQALHDDGVKEVLGERGRLGGDDVCRIALAQDACGRLLAGKLLRFFVRPDPAPDVVAAFGAELRARDYDLAAALELLFGSRYFFDAASRRALVKSPLEFVVGVARVLGLRLAAKETLPALRAMGQDLLAPPNVKGWPGHRAWIDTTRWLVRVNAARDLAAQAAEAPPGLDADLCLRVLCGTAVPEPERARLDRAGAGRRARIHALLALPEAHLA